MTTAMWVFLGIGVVGGFFVGRWWGEATRARYDMDRVWDARRDYRDG